MLGVYSPGETMSDADAERGLSVFNDMLDSWSNESLACYAVLEQSGTLIVNQQSYTIGTGGNFNVTRPMRINVGPGCARIRDASGSDYDMEVVPQEKWNLIGLKTNTSNIPDTLFYDPQFPLGIINVFPVPNIAYTMYWDSYLQLVNFANLSSTMALPPGYKRAFTTNLAVCLKPYFRDAQIDPLIILEAQERKGNIKRTNMRENIALMDPELVSRASPVYNIFRDKSGA